MELKTPAPWFRKLLEQSGFSKFADFSHKHSFAGKAKIIILAWAVMIIWNAVMFFLVKNFLLIGKTTQEAAQTLFGAPFIGAKFISDLLNLPLNDVTYGLGLFSISTASTFAAFAAITFLRCILPALWEEIIFRRMPINFAQGHDRILKVVDRMLGSEVWGAPKISLVIPAVLSSSIIFGIMHGSILNLFFQGVGGLLFSYVYIKCNNSYWSVFALHALWNFSLLFLLPLLLI